MPSRFSLRRGRHLLESGTGRLRARYFAAVYPGLTVHGRVRVSAGCDIRVADGGRLDLTDVHLGRGVSLAVGPAGRMELKGPSVGPNSVLVARELVVVGAGSLLAEMVVVRDSHHERDEDGSLVGQRHRSAPVVIGPHVWVGARAVVLAGVCIGSGATVGAGAVVTKDVANGTTVVGVPAASTSTATKESA